MDEKKDEKKAPEHGWVTLVMKGDAYVPGAIALAQSLRETKTSADIVCMTTDDVTLIDDLKSVFDYVIPVNYIRRLTKPLLTDRQNEIYGSWLDVSYTKWNILGLEQYTKVIFIDADALVLNNMDHLFELEAPAATFSSPWAKNFRTHAYQSKLEKSKRDKDDFALNYTTEHNGVVKPEEIMHALTNKGYTFIASLVLLQPGGLKNFLSGVNEPFGYDCYSTPDEQSLAWFMASRKVSWRHIHQRYNFIIHKPEWLAAGDVPHMLHYFNNLKPWQMTKSWMSTPFNTDRIWWWIFHLWVLKTGRQIKLPTPSVDLLSKKEDHYWRMTFTSMDTKYFPWLPAMTKKRFPNLVS